MGILVLIVLGIFLIAFRIFKIGDLFSPWFITTGIWFVLILLLQFNNGILYPVSDQFYTCSWLWIPILSISAIITYSVLPIQNTNKNKQIINVNKPVFIGLLILATIITPLYLYQILKVVMRFGSDDFLYNMRAYNIGGEKNFGILNYSSIIGQILLVIGIWMYPKISKIQLTLIFIINIIVAFAIMGKSPVTFILITTIFALYEKGYIKIKYILLAIIPFFLLFFIFTNARSMSGSSSQDLTLIDFIGMYVLSPPVAFGYVTENISPQFGYNTFSAVYRFLNDWGIGSFSISPGIQPFVYVPIPTNVYTIYQPFFKDFGYAGIAYFAMLYGVVCGYLYRQCMNGNSICKCIYTFIIPSLILQFFQEGLIVRAISSIEFVILIIICTQKVISFKNCSP